MESPRTRRSARTEQTGWTGMHDAKGGMKTEIQDQPTPRRARIRVHAPTPETGHRTSKRIAASTSTTIAPSLPTPTTIPRKRKSPQPDHDDAQPSPTGHTTFAFTASATASTSRSEVTPRRRAGQMFNQRMETGTRSGSARHGVGVGMGGSRASGHKVDQIIPGKTLAAAATIAGPHDDNPFVVPGSAAALSSPGRLTRHRAEEKVDPVSPRPSRSKAFRSPPALIADPIHSATSLLSPPPTQRVQRIHFGPIPPSPRTLRRQAQEKAKAEKMQKMRDEEDNPFLVKPGQAVSHRPGPIVDETQPTVTYVFRGAKKTFANPWAGADHDFPEANLDIEDDDYEPHPCPAPKLLWPTETPPRATTTPKRSSRRLRLGSDDEASPQSSPVPTPHTTGRDRARFESGARFESDDEFLPEPREDVVPAKKGLRFEDKLRHAAETDADAGESRRTRRRM